MQDIGPRLRDLRVSRGLSVRATAKAIGVSDTYLSRVERGEQRPSERCIRRLAEALEVRSDELFAAAGIIPADVREKLCADAERYDLVRAF